MIMAKTISKDAGLFPCTVANRPQKHTIKQPPPQIETVDDSCTQLSNMCLHGCGHM